MGAIPYWGTSPDVWDRLYINDTLVPGTVRITLKRAPRYDTRKPPKYHGAVLSDNGESLAEGVIEIALGFDSVEGQSFGTAEEQWEAWQDLEQDLIGRAVSTREAVTVQHPAFRIGRVARVCLEDPPSMEGSGPGLRVIKIPWSQFGKVVRANAGTGRAGTVGPAKAKTSTDIDTLKKPSSTETAP